MLIIEIALGIVVAVVILYYLPTILALGLVLVVGVLGIAAVVGLGWLFYTYPQALVVLLVIVGVFLAALGWVEWDERRTKRLDQRRTKVMGIPPSARLAQADREEAGYGSAGVSAREQSNPSVLSHSITQTIGFIAKYKQRFTWVAAAFVILGMLGTWYYVEPGLVPSLMGIYGFSAFLILLFVLYCRTFYEANSKKPGIDNGVDQKDGEPQMLAPSGVHDDDRPH